MECLLVHCVNCYSVHCTRYSRKGRQMPRLQPSYSMHVEVVATDWWFVDAAQSILLAEPVGSVIVYRCSQPTMNPAIELVPKMTSCHTLCILPVIGSQYHWASPSAFFLGPASNFLCSWSSNSTMFIDGQRLWWFFLSSFVVVNWLRRNRQCSRPLHQGKSITHYHSYMWVTFTYSGAIQWSCSQWCCHWVVTKFLIRQTTTSDLNPIWKPLVEKVIQCPFCKNPGYFQKPMI